MDTVTKAIAIGDGAVADKPNQFTIKVNGYSGSTILTDTEHAVLYNVLQRMGIKQDN